MADKIESELDEREPELDESSDYEKPLSQKKRNWILIAFAVALAVYFLYAVVMGGMGS
jgi:hypothetical protein